MVKKIYKTNKGKILDMEAMRQQNEKTVAAGNMSVNSKGDIVRGRKIIKTAKERVAASYNKTTQVKQVSLKTPLAEKDTKIDQPDESKLSEINTSEMTTETIKTREDGTKYSETISPSGDIEIKELSKPKGKKKIKSNRKKVKANPKRPLI